MILCELLQVIHESSDFVNFARLLLNLLSSAQALRDNHIYLTEARARREEEITNVSHPYRHPVEHRIISCYWHARFITWSPLIISLFGSFYTNDMMACLGDVEHLMCLRFSRMSTFKSTNPKPSPSHQILALLKKPDGIISFFFCD